MDIFASLKFQTQHVFLLRICLDTSGWFPIFYLIILETVHVIFFVAFYT